jgi:MFS transporter, PAT family, beta-lactamase induction signal transducer AmpG
MQPAEGALAESGTPSARRERSWLFSFLIAPEAVISVGLINGGLSYLLRDEGVNPARAASIVALLTLPHTIYFLWGPVTDFFIRRRTWLLLAAALSALTLLLAFHQPRLSSTWGIALIFIAACIGVMVPAACGGMMGTLHSEVSRRRAGSFYQSGSLTFGAIATFLVVSCSGRFSLFAIGCMIAALIAVPALAAFAIPAQPVISGRAHETASRIWSEFKSTFLRWEAIPYTLLVTFPMCSGGMLGLLPELARDYGVSGSGVAWMNGVAGAVLTTLGALAVALIPVRVRASVAFLIAGLANAASLAILAIGPLRPMVYYISTVLFLFTIGACYALFTGVSLEFLGSSGKSGSTRYAIINSLGNLPVAYMSWADGRGYAHWGPRGMPAADAVLSTVGASLLLAHFVFSRRKRSMTTVH